MYEEGEGGDRGDREGGHLREGFQGDKLSDQAISLDLHLKGAAFEYPPSLIQTRQGSIRHAQGGPESLGVVVGTLQGLGG
jgi:hypothetical protein